MIDRPEFCDFSFGAIVNRSPLIIGISTDGAAPVFGQALRARIEALIPLNFAAWALASAGRDPDSGDLDALLAASAGEQDVFPAAEGFTGAERS